MSCASPRGRTATQNRSRAQPQTFTFLQLDLPAVRSPQPGREAEKCQGWGGAASQLGPGDSSRAAWQQRALINHPAAARHRKMRTAQLQELFKASLRARITLDTPDQHTESRLGGRELGLRLLSGQRRPPCSSAARHGHRAAPDPGLSPWAQDPAELPEQEDSTREGPGASSQPAAQSALCDSEKCAQMGARWGLPGMLWHEKQWIWLRF